MPQTVRSRIDRELTRHVGKWFTVRDIQDRVRVSPATLKPLIMRYARENVLRRRRVRGTARAVQFSPIVGSKDGFQKVLRDFMPYRRPKGSVAGKSGTKNSPVQRTKKGKITGKTPRGGKSSPARRRSR